MVDIFMAVSQCIYMYMYAQSRFNKWHVNVQHNVIGCMLILEGNLNFGGKVGFGGKSSPMYDTLEGTLGQCLQLTNRIPLFLQGNSKFGGDFCFES